MIDADEASLPIFSEHGGTNTLYAGLLSPVVAFTYQGTQYQLWVAKANGQGVVKVAQVVSGKPQFLKVLTAADFTNSTVTTAKADIGALITAAGTAATAATLPKAPAKPSASQLTAAQNAAQPLPGAEQQVIKDILANACAALNAGCFAAGSMIWTPDGYRAVEDIMPGDRVWARSEWDPASPIEAKEVEARFVRLGRILHLHFPDGELIRTTPEHPFWVEGRGWTAAGALVAGNRVATRSGEWVAISEVFDTEQWETVYNVRVAEYHTYFVGEEAWGWAAWAHNAYLPGANQDYSLQGDEYATIARMMYPLLQAYAPSVVATIAVSDSVSHPLRSYVYIFYRPSTATAAQMDEARTNLIDGAHSDLIVVLIPGGGSAQHAERRLYDDHHGDIVAIGVSNKPCDDCVPYFTTTVHWPNVWWL